MRFGEYAKIRGNPVVFCEGPLFYFVVEAETTDYIARVRLEEDGDFIDFARRDRVPLSSLYPGKRCASDLLDSDVPDTAEFIWGREGARAGRVTVDTKDLLLIGRLEKQLEEQGIIWRSAA